MSDLISRSELTESIKRQYCTGCDNYNGSRCRACHADDMLSLVDDAADAMHRWISMEEKHPKYSEEVLICKKVGKYKMLAVGYLDEDGCFYTGEGWFAEVTHWMPLPEPPKEE